MSGNNDPGKCAAHEEQIKALKEDLAEQKAARQTLQRLIFDKLDELGDRITERFDRVWNNGIHDLDKRVALLEAGKQRKPNERLGDSSNPLIAATINPA